MGLSWRATDASWLTASCILRPSARASAWAHCLPTFAIWRLRGARPRSTNRRSVERCFGGSQDYDSAVDGIVRSQASRLRQRLEMYFEQEGSNEPVQIVIPRGGYVPIFQTQSTFAPAPPVTDPLRPIPETPFLDPNKTGATHPRGIFSRQWLPWGLSWFWD